MPDTVQLDGSPLRPEQVVAIARGGAPVAVSADALAAVARCREAVEGCLDDGEQHYGVNTGFGSLSRQTIDGEQLGALQTNLIRSHAAGAGEPLADEVVRAMLALLAASLCRARSGVRPALVEGLVAMLNAGVTPVVPAIGSVGASGDLAPLSHAVLVLIGEGEAVRNGRRQAGAAALREAGLAPMRLGAKEGLALINGTHLMAGRMALLWHDYQRVFRAGALACAMSIDAVRASDAFLDERVYHARNQPGPRAVAAMIRGFMAGSAIVSSHRFNDPRVQDPYSLRCAAIVLGAVHDLGAYVASALEAELGAVTDNPLVFAGDDGTEIVSAGNFHGMPVAIPMDALGVGLAHLAGIAERRVYHMLSAYDKESRLNPFLSPQPGLHSGFMIAQYTAAAACNELQGLAYPASVANITTSAGMEDYNSFGPRSAAKAERGVALARTVVAIELLCAAQAIETHRPLRTGDTLETAHALIRTRVAALTEDRPPAPDIAAIEELIASGAFHAL